MVRFIQERELSFSQGSQISHTYFRYSRELRASSHNLIKPGNHCCLSEAEAKETLDFIYRSHICQKVGKHCSKPHDNPQFFQIKKIPEAPRVWSVCLRSTSCTESGIQTRSFVSKGHVHSTKTWYCLPNRFPGEPSPLSCMCTPNLYSRSRHWVPNCLSP